MVSSLARPGGNVTGITSNWDDLSGKRLELLKETIPKLSRIAVLWHSSGGRSTQWKASQTAAKQMKLQLHSMQIRAAADLEGAFNEAVKARSGAVAVTQSPVVGAIHTTGHPARHKTSAARNLCAPGGMRKPAG